MMNGGGEGRERYSRQIKLLGEEGQRRLRDAKVLVAGVGGLGSYVSYELAAIGIGKLILADHQAIELSDLNRQILYSTSDVGRAKVEVAREKLTALNPEVEVEAVNEPITEDNVRDLVAEADLAVDGLDNWVTRLVVNDESVRQGKPFIHGGVSGFYGEVHTVIPGKGPCLRCIVPKPPKDVSPQVVSGVVGVIASMEVVEVVKVITGKGRPAYDRILIYDGLKQTISHVEVSKRPDCPVCSNRYVRQA